jgi:predicted small secreted protein
MQKYLVVLFIFLSGLLTACHTFNGVGEDVRAGGHAISRASGTSN